MRSPGVLLVTLTATMFLVAGGGTAVAPFLLDIARDLGAELSAVANLFAIMSIPWGIASIAAGAASDRLGRRLILVGGVAAMAASRIGLAGAAGYPAAVWWHLLTGIGGGTFSGTVFATVSDAYPPGQRGRALGWLMTGQSLALVLGTPLLTLVGAVAGWRGALAVQGSAIALTGVAVWLVAPGAPRRTEPAARQPAVPLLRLLVPRVVLLLAAAAMERVCFAVATVYLATYLVTSYGITPAPLALALGVIALGSLAGNVLGGQVADRVRARPLAFAVALVATGTLALPLMLWRPGVAVSVALGFGYSLANAIGRPSLLSSLAEVSSEARGAILGLNITIGSLGWIGATAIGGWLLDGFGFGSLGVFCALAGASSAGLAAGSWVSGRRSPRPLDLRGDRGLP
jgi:predicted MFS family arabinose efflux permease